MIDPKVFLDPAAITFLWNRITTELNKKADSADLANVATSGTAADLTITDTGNYFSSGTVEGALQEIGNSLESSGAVTINETAGSGNVLKVYTISQHGSVVGTINIPKDLVATSGEIVNSDGTNSGTFLKLIIANSDPIYINVASLIEYNGVTDSEEIDFTDTNHQISGTLKVGSIAKTKLASGVQTSLGKADTALQPSDITEGATNGTIAVNGTDVKVHGLGTAAFTSASAYYVKPQTGIPLADLAAGVVPVLAGTGQNSFTDGPDNIASGRGTFAGGTSSTASGWYSLAHGLSTTASGDSSLAIGQGVSATGSYAVAFGVGSTSNNSGTLAGGAGAHANGAYSFAWGAGAQANGNYSSVMGMGLILDTYLTHGFGQFNERVNPYEFEEWEPSTWYSQGDRVKVTTTYDDEEYVAYYICKTANDDDEFDSSHWFNTNEHLGRFVEIVGGGLDNSNRKNIRALDWAGNERLYGSLFVYANEDGTGGVPVLTEDDLPVQRGNGYGSIVAGDHASANGMYSFAFGEYTRASGANSFAFGSYNQENDLSSVPTWDENATYKYGDIVKLTNSSIPSYTYTNYYFNLGHSNATRPQNYSNDWLRVDNFGKYIEVVGNGYTDPETDLIVRSNARALDWAGNQYLMGDLFVQCASDSTNGIKVATAVDTILTTTLSRGRYDYYPVGEGSLAFGNSVAASGNYSVALGKDTVAAGDYSFVFGVNNFTDSYNDWYDLSEWTANTEYSSGDWIKITTTNNNDTVVNVYKCINDNSDAEFDSSNWLDLGHRMRYVEIVGNGDDNYPSNARTLDWFGNEFLAGQLTAKGLNITSYGGTASDYSICFGVGVTASGTYSLAGGSGATASGYNAVAFGSGVTASGSGAFAHGFGSQATASAAFATGSGNIASGSNAFSTGGMAQASGAESQAMGEMVTATGLVQHVFGRCNVIDIVPDYDNWDVWVANTSYSIGDEIQIDITTENEWGNTDTTTYYYVCAEANSDSVFDPTKWNSVLYGQTKYIEIVGCGKNSSSRANARALDWDGNEYLKGDVFVRCNNDSSGGTRLVKMTDVATQNDYGVVKVKSGYGIDIGTTNQHVGFLRIYPASTNDIKAGTSYYAPITVSKQHESVFYALSKLAGVDLASGSDTVGIYPANSKQAIQKMLGINGLIGPYEDDLVADQAYAINDVFVYGGSLYKATAAIAASGVITPGTNCDPVTAKDVFVKKTDHATQQEYGVVVPGAGLIIVNDKMCVNPCGVDKLKQGTSSNLPVTPLYIDAATFYGLARAAGVNMSSSDNPVGTYTDEAKTAIRGLIDAVGTTDYASSQNAGVVKVGEAAYGIQMAEGGFIRTKKATDSNIKGGGNSFQPIVPDVQHKSVYYALAKAAGADMASVSGETVGVYPQAQKTAIQTMLGIEADIPLIEEVSGTTPSITGLPNVRYICGEVSTLSITPPASGSVVVRFDSGSTATVLTVPSTVKWPVWFDASSLSINTTYEIIITDGVYGAVMSWA